MPETQTKRELLREKHKQEQRRKTTTFLLIAAVAVLLIALLVFLPKLLSQQSKYAAATGFSVGDPNAPITVVEFSNFGCSHCKTFSEESEDQFIEDYVDPGKVYFTYVNIPYNSEDYLAAAEASYCAAEQNQFFEYKDLLFTYVGATDAFSEDNLVQYAGSAGMNTTEFQACLDSDVYAQAYLDDYAYAESVGLQGTPSFLINGKQLVFTSQLYTTLDELIQN